MKESNLSAAELLASRSEEAQEQFYRTLTDVDATALNYNWRFWARPNQIIPGTPGAASQRSDWRYWLCQAGRGWGKTRVGAETVREWGENPTEIIHMIAPTAGDVRGVMIEGPSGLMSCYPHGRRPSYNPSLHMVTFPSGAVAKTFSADEPERLRGPQCTKFWADEMCAWRFIEDAWDNLMFGFRLPGVKLQGVITTTPKPIAQLKKILANPNTEVTRGSTYDNRANLSEAFYEDVVKPYEGTRIGRQELLAELLEDTPGALWNRGIIDASRWKNYPVDEIVRCVVAIDPAVTAGEDSDETGIVVVALLRDGHVIVLDDLTCRESPLNWAKIAVTAYHSRRADRIVGEVNNGGDLVGANIRAVAPNVAFRAVRASRGKAVRAEPVAALYEQGRVHHVGSLGALEDQMCAYVPGVPGKSPDRMDALVWGITELLIDLDQTPQYMPAVLPVRISQY